MKNKISLFPKFDIDRFTDYFEFDEPSFSYLKYSQEFEMAVENEKGAIVLSADDWDINECDLKINWKFICKRPTFLYDVASLGAIACHDAKIGIALQWYSKTSKQRGSVPVGVIENVSKNQTFECNYVFEKSNFRGSLGFSLILYIKEAGHPNDNEMYFANTPGCILGSLDEYEVILEGTGSDFPIFEYSGLGDPLWKLVCDISSPDTDSLEEHVAVYINKDHRFFSRLDRRSPDFDPQIFAEVMSQVLTLIIETVRADGYDFSNFDNAQSGSVASALLYFRDVLKWNFDSPIELSYSIRKHLETQFNQK